MIVGVMLAVLVVMALISNRYTKSVADYLAAGRVGGRYMMTMASGMVWIGAINIVAMFELYHTAGFTAMWWVLLTTPLTLYINISGWGVYRLRETRALTTAQYLETRYGKGIRVLSGALAWLTGMINFGIFPAIGARFFVHFVGLPESFAWLGLQWQTFPLVMAILLGVSLFFVFAGGHVAVIVTDCLQGMFTQVAAVIIIVVMGYLWFDWDRIIDVLTSAEAGKSLLNPLDTGNIGDFSFSYFIIGVIGFGFTILSHLQSQAYIASSKTAHEFRMGSALNQWRWQALCLFFLVLVLCAMVAMQHPDFAHIGAVINEQLNGISPDAADATRQQLTITVALGNILPRGIAGLFCAIMVAALISTYDSFMHTWGAVFLQDMVMPFRKKPFAPKQHIWFLRLSILGVAVFAFIYSLFFKNQESILMYFALVNNIWLGGSGAVILGGLYWKRGTALAAWTTLILGAVLGILGIVLTQGWPVWFDGTKFPVNPQWIWLWTIVISTTTYIFVSLLGNVRFNMDKLLHRGEYAVESDQTHVDRQTRWHHKIFAIDHEFNRFDRFTAYSIVGWFLFWAAFFGVGTVYATVAKPDDTVWASFWHVYLWILFVLAVITTVWFTWGGTRDLIYLFRSLGSQERDASDDGTVKGEHE
ncbi:MAG: sodium:solute symporter [Verrucomicrobia bacterium]|nr:sodium:solute symporter [Verrucomicrobiota bacterium]